MQRSGARAELLDCDTFEVVPPPPLVLLQRIAQGWNTLDAQTFSQPQNWRKLGVLRRGRGGVVGWLAVDPVRTDYRKHRSGSGCGGDAVAPCARDKGDLPLRMRIEEPMRWGVVGWGAKLTRIARRGRTRNVEGPDQSIEAARTARDGQRGSRRRSVWDKGPAPQVTVMKHGRKISSLWHAAPSPISLSQYKGQRFAERTASSDATAPQNRTSGETADETVAPNAGPPDRACLTALWDRDLWPVLPAKHRSLVWASEERRRQGRDVDPTKDAVPPPEGK
ncbi:hypothetical protein EDB84DRAFT_1435264 [Lactarius hengduanensis]|nr:hypothetical protein EDB84DRAFT_1435264 [Lactarius hengduanensis]